VRLANESEYGLSGSVWTNDPEKGLAIARSVRTGGLTINNAAPDLLSPFGGFKQSGIGRAFGPEAINHYIEHKTVAVGGRTGEQRPSHPAKCRRPGGPLYQAQRSDLGNAGAELSGASLLGRASARPARARVPD